MNLFYKLLIKKIFSSAIAASLFLPGLFFPWLGMAAENRLQSALNEAVEKVGEISEINKNESLGEEEKEQKELRVRKDALAKIFDLTLLEDEDLKNKLSGLANLNEEQKKIRNGLLDLLLENESSYGEMRNRLAETKTIEEVKQLALDFKNWRKAVYNPKVEKIISFSLVFQQKRILGIANERLTKIKSDLKKLEGADLIKKEDTAHLLQKAVVALKKAAELNNRAEALVTEVLTSELFPPAPNIEITKIENPEEIKLTDAPKKEEKKEPSVKALVEESLKQVKTSYRLFIEIGKLVREKLSSR